MFKVNWKDIRWRGKKGSQLFEELCVDILKLEGFNNLNWRKGSADGGRDIEGEKVETEIDSSIRRDKYWFQCKIYKSGVGIKQISDSLIQANQSSINVFVIITSSYLTPQLNDEIRKANEQHKYGFRITSINGKTLEEKIFRYQRKFFNPFKYLEVELTNESIIKRLNQNEKRNYYNLIKRKETLILKITKQTDKEISKELFDLATKYITEFNKIKRFADSLDLLRVLDKSNIIPTQKTYVKKEIGNIYLNLEWGYSAVANFEEALKIGEFTLNVQEISFIRFLLAKGYILEFAIPEAEMNFKSALSYFSGKKTKINNQILYGLVDLYLTKENYEQAKRYLKKVTRKTNQDVLEALIRTIRIYNNQGSYNSTIREFKKIRTKLSGRNRILLRVLYEVVFAYWHLGNMNEALNILENDCHRYIKMYGNDEDLMVLYENLSLLKRENKSLDIAAWDDHNKFIDVLNKVRGYYHKGIIKGLYASESILNGNYSAALDQLNSSQKLFREIGSWDNVYSNYVRYGNLFLSTGRILDALNFYFKVGDKDKIIKSSQLALMHVDANSLNHFLIKLLRIKNLNIREKVGLCYYIIYLYEIIKDEDVSLVTQRLLNLSNDQSSTLTGFNVSESSLEALLAVSRIIKSNQAKEIINRMCEILLSNAYWHKKDLAVKVIRETCSHLKTGITQKLLKTIGDIYLSLLSSKKKIGGVIIRELEWALYYLISDSQSKLHKDYIIKIFSKNRAFNNLEIHHLLNRKITTKQIFKLINRVVIHINGSIKIQKNYEKSKDVNMNGYFYIRTQEKGKDKIHTGAIAGLFPFHILKDYKISNKHLSLLIETFINNIQNKYGFLVNKEILISNLTEIPLTKESIPIIFNCLMKILNGNLFLTPEEEQQILQSSDPFTKNRVAIGSRERLVKIAIMVLAKLSFNFNKDQRSSLLQKINGLSSSSSEEIRIACAYSYMYFSLKTLDDFLYYHTLLNDRSEKVVEQAIYSFFSINKNLWLLDYRIATLRRIMLLCVDNYNSLGINLASAYIVKKVYSDGGYSMLNSEIMDSYKILKNHKYFSVRNVFK